MSRQLTQTIDCLNLNQLTLISSALKIIDDNEMETAKGQAIIAEVCNVCDFKLVEIEQLQKELNTHLSQTNIDPQEYNNYFKNKWLKAVNNEGTFLTALREFKLESKLEASIEIAKQNKMNAVTGNLNL
jgi:hypothetical protein